MSFNILLKHSLCAGNNTLLYNIICLPYFKSLYTHIYVYTHTSLSMFFSCYSLAGIILVPVIIMHNYDIFSLFDLFIIFLFPHILVKMLYKAATVLSSFQRYMTRDTWFNTEFILFWDICCLHTFLLQVKCFQAIGSESWQHLHGK